MWGAGHFYNLFLKKGRGGHVTWWNKADDRTSFEFYNNFIDSFFLFTPILLTFSLKFADKEEAAGLFQEVVLSYRHNCSRKKNGNLVSLLKTYFSRNFDGFCGPDFFPWVRSFFSSFSFLLATSWTSWFLHGRWFDFDLPCGTRGCGGTNPIFDLCCHGHECLFNISRVLGRGLQAWNAQLVSVFL